jgi:hypothetical protein
VPVVQLLLLPHGGFAASARDVCGERTCLYTYTRQHTDAGRRRRRRGRRRQAQAEQSELPVARELF